MKNIISITLKFFITAHIVDAGILPMGGCSNILPQLNRLVKDTKIWDLYLDHWDIFSPLRENGTSTRALNMYLDPSPKSPGRIHTVSFKGVVFFALFPVDEHSINLLPITFLPSE